MTATIRRLVTGYYQAPAAVTLLGGGEHPEVPGGRLESYGFEEAIEVDGVAFGPGTMIPIPAWLVQTPTSTILVDTGSPPLSDVNAMHQRYVRQPIAATVSTVGSISEQLAALGIEPEDIDIVVNTHLHYDHSGANSLFNKAVFLIHEREVAWALCPPPWASYYYREMRDQLLAVIDQVQLVSSDHVVTSEVRIVPTGGHSPGHVVVEVETDDGSAVIAGDAIYAYRSLEYGWPPGAFFDLGGIQQLVQTLKHSDLILLCHDPAFSTLFPTDLIGDGDVPDATHAYMERLRTAVPLPLSTFDPKALPQPNLW